MVKKEKSFDERVAFLEGKAREMRVNILKMIHHAQSGHPGGSLSATDYVTALYFDVMQVDPENPQWEERDRFVLSKGHACPVWYTVLALRGYFPVEELKTLRQFETRLQGHPVWKKLPGIEATTGSLGVGFSTALGMALEMKLSKSERKVYTALGDGELAEGIVWEAASYAGAKKLDNLVAIVDANGLQNDGYTRDLLSFEPIEDKFRAFGWETLRIKGHDMGEVLKALEMARDYRKGPFCIVAETTKGRGVSFMEDVRGWHGKAPNEEELAQAICEITGA